MRTPLIMRKTLLALLPGAVVWCTMFGPGAVINLLMAMLTAIALEAIMLKIRQKPMAQLSDGTILLTGALLGLCLPPLLPVWLVMLGVAFAVIFGKHLYGGTGSNVFNPAMVGYAVLIISFPLAMSFWPAPASEQSVTSVLELKFVPGAEREHFDGITSATPLDAYKFREGLTNDEFFSGERADNWQHWLWLNVAFLAGGIYLLQQKIIPWQTPVAMLATIGVLSLLFYDGGSSESLGSPLFMLFSGACMMAAFFIVTDPVTCPGYKPGLIVFGIGVGLITYIIRAEGAYPEGIAFAVLLMNAASPLIDHLFVLRDQRT